MVKDPAGSLRVVLLFDAGPRSGVKTHGVDARLAIGIRPVLSMAHRRASTRDGEAFKLSWLGLPTTARDRGLRLDAVRFRSRPRGEAVAQHPDRASWNAAEPWPSALRG